MAKQLLMIGREKGRWSNHQTFFVSNGINIYLVGTVSEGLVLLRALRIDGVVLRLDRAASTDLGVLNDLRSQHPQIPLLVISGMSSRHVEVESFVVTGRGHLATPMIQEHSQTAWFIFEGHLN